MIRVSTTIGKGSKAEGTGAVHGAPLGEADIAAAKKCWGFDEKKSFEVRDEVYALYRRRQEEGARLEREWDATLARYAVMHPTLAAEFSRRFTGQAELPAGWEASLPTFTAADKQLATRQSSQLVLNKLCESLPELVGGSADLTPSNLTKAKGALDFQRETPEGRYIRFGVREVRARARRDAWRAPCCVLLPRSCSTLARSRSRFHPFSRPRSRSRFRLPAGFAPSSLSCPARSTRWPRSATASRPSAVSSPSAPPF
jgi:transketolase